MKAHKHNLLATGKTNLLTDKLKLIEGKMEHLKLERSRLLAMEKSDYLASLNKFKQKAGY